ncbi:MAG: hypothetical protein M1827_001493 [Pycnora praestabilis]|nr:MAG: hypothetical protein M1827_001493 [Pycnora praestabilis]
MGWEYCPQHKRVREIREEDYGLPSITLVAQFDLTPLVIRKSVGLERRINSSTRLSSVYIRQFLELRERHSSPAPPSVSSIPLPELTSVFNLKNPPTTITLNPRSHQQDAKEPCVSPYTEDDFKDIDSAIAAIERTTDEENTQESERMASNNQNQVTADGGLEQSPTTTTTSPTVPENEANELVDMVDDLLDKMGAKFQAVSADIFTKLDDMSRRLDNLEASIVAGQSEQSK